MLYIVGFIIWTCLVKCVDVQPLGVNETMIGFASLNCWFHKWTGVHMNIYTITDWFGLIPVFICVGFGVFGCVQWIKRRSIRMVDRDLIWLGVHYVMVIFAYLLFEMIPINYRPVLINGFMEASYPSSTTLLVLGVMPTLTEQVKRRTENVYVQSTVRVLVFGFSVFMVGGRLISGVHWLTDIVGSILLSRGLFCIYKGKIK